MARDIVTSENRAEFMAKKLGIKDKKKQDYPMAPHGTWYGEGTYEKDGGILRKVSPDKEQEIVQTQRRRGQAIWPLKINL